MREVVIVDAVRSPLGRRNGALREVHPVALGAHVLAALLERNHLAPAEVDHLVWGCVSQASEQAFNVARNTWLHAGFPVETAATSIDFQCGSGQQSTHIAAAMVGSGQYDLVIAGGVESMSRIPMGASLAGGAPFTEQIMAQHNIIHQGMSSDKIARQWNIPREELDQFSALSHAKAAKATEMGWFKNEIVPIMGVDDTGAPVEVASDQGIRPSVSLEKMGTLKPAFGEDGVTTAGNSSQITDGAAALIITTLERARELGLTPRARIVAATTVGSDPHLMLTGPVAATQKVLAKAGKTIHDMDHIEINEAFATVVSMWKREIQPEMDRVNPHGGAIALGHPLGASGARITATLLNALHTHQKGRALQTICCGGGMATGMIVERMN